MKTFRCLILLILSPIILPAQGHDFLIGRSYDSYYPNEPAVCMNPLNHQQILVGTNPYFTYYSSNMGKTWTKRNVSSNHRPAGDPVVMCDEKGEFYSFFLVSGLKGVECFKFDKQSRRWTPLDFFATNGTKEIDKEWACFDPVTQAFYCSWSEFDKHGSIARTDSTTIYLSRSDDYGHSWSDPVRVNDQKGGATGGVGSAHGSMPATGLKGEVYVSWWGPEGLLFDRSMDGGKTWLEQDIVVNPYKNWLYSIPGIEITPSFPNIACDRSDGPNRGTLYLNWSDKRRGMQDSDIWISKSTDNGNTWSEPIRVNNDRPGKHQFFNTMSIDPVTGNVYVLFYDRRDHNDNNTDIYLAISTDGGTRFTNLKISDDPFLPYADHHFGHYMDVSVHNDTAIVVWNRQHNRSNSVWGDIYIHNSTGLEPKYDLEMKGKLYPNPTSGACVLEFSLDLPSEVFLDVLDASGKTVQTVLQGKRLNQGVHQIDINTHSNLPSGIYHIRLQAGGISRSWELVIQ